MRSRPGPITLQLDRDDMEEVFEDNFPIFLGVLRVMARALVASRKKLGRDAGHPRANSSSWMRGLGELGLVERILILRRTLDFAGAEIEALADLAQQAEEIVQPVRQPLWAAGDAADHFIILLSGRVRPGSRCPVFFRPGSIVGGVESFCAKTAGTPPSPPATRLRIQVRTCSTSSKTTSSSA
jgi:CRP-like cAMP-binding protein